MNNRLQKFLDAENITQSQFADTVGVARASVSHILSGRNKPGFDFIESISIHYPELNLEWLVNGKGKMYKTVPSPASQETEGNGIYRNSLFPEARNAEGDIPDFSDKTFDTGQSPTPISAARKPASQSMETDTKKESAPLEERTVSKIIVFFSDGTFQEIP